MCTIGRVLSYSESICINLNNDSIFFAQQLELEILKPIKKPLSSSAIVLAA